MIWLHSELWHAETRSEPSETSTMENPHRPQNSLHLLVYFYKKAPPWMVDWALNLSLSYDHATKLINVSNAMRKIITKS